MRYTDKEKRELADAFIASLEEGSAPYGKDYADGHRDGFKVAQELYTDKDTVPEIDVDADLKAFANAGTFSVEDMVKGLEKAFGLKEKPEYTEAVKEHIEKAEEMVKDMFSIKEEECDCPKLGDRVIDGLTGFKGTATAQTTYLDGNHQVEITAHVGADNKPPESIWVDASRIEKVQ